MFFWINVLHRCLTSLHIRHYKNYLPRSYLLPLVYELCRAFFWGSSFYGTSEKKKKQNLRSVAPKVVILRLRHYQDSQIVVYIDFKLWTSKLTKKQLFREKLSKRKSYLVLQDPSFNFILKEYAYTVTYTRLDLAMRYSI